MRAEELKGHLDGLILAVVAREPLHGYAVIEAAEGAQRRCARAAGGHGLPGAAPARGRRPAQERVVDGVRPASARLQHHQARGKGARRQPRALARVRGHDRGGTRMSYLNDAGVRAERRRHPGATPPADRRRVRGPSARGPERPARRAAGSGAPVRGRARNQPRPQSGLPCLRGAGVRRASAWWRCSSRSGGCAGSRCTGSTGTSRRRRGRRRSC